MTGMNRCPRCGTLHALIWDQGRFCLLCGWTDGDPEDAIGVTYALSPARHVTGHGLAMQAEMDYQGERRTA